MDFEAFCEKCNLSWMRCTCDGGQVGKLRAEISRLTRERDEAVAMLHKVADECARVERLLAAAEKVVEAMRGWVDEHLGRCPCYWCGALAAYDALKAKGGKP
jgi:hypothetical protein